MKNLTEEEHKKAAEEEESAEASEFYYEKLSNIIDMAEKIDSIHYHYRNATFDDDDEATKKAHWMFCGLSVLSMMQIVLIYENTHFDEDGSVTPKSHYLAKLGRVIAEGYGDEVTVGVSHRGLIQDFLRLIKAGIDEHRSDEGYDQIPWHGVIFKMNELDNEAETAKKFKHPLMNALAAHPEAVVEIKPEGEPEGEADTSMDGVIAKLQQAIVVAENTRKELRKATDMILNDPRYSESYK